MATLPLPPRLGAPVARDGRFLGDAAIENILGSAWFCPPESPFQ